MDCPARIIEMSDGDPPRIRPENERDCMQCQHCLTVCPTGAISILGRDPRASLPLDREHLPSLDQMSVLVRGRRSVRRYRDENVDPQLLRRLLADAANAPTGVNARKLTFRVIDDKEVQARFRRKALDRIIEADQAGTLPESARYLKRIVSLWQSEGRDLLFRGAPHALIVSAPPDAPCPEQDVVIALAYFELLAQSAGLGTVWWGMLSWVLETLPDLKEVLGIPSDHKYYAMLFGVPAFQYARTAQRDDAAVVLRVDL
jgi:nitroreductase